jgi:hypothetical protein
MGDYFLRNVPESLHSDWAYFSGKMGLSMRFYILAALKRQIIKDKTKSEGNNNETDSGNEQGRIGTGTPETPGI